MIKKFIIGLLFTAYASSSFAIEPFTISDVKVIGNGRLDDGTIFNYLPLKVGDEVDDEESRLSIKALFETGFFRNVKLSKQGTTLVVEVEERPSIARINLDGNKAIKDAQINSMLETAEIIKGRILNQRRLNEVIKGLSEAYFAKGRYSAEIKQKVTTLDQNRAQITLRFEEGGVATIKEIDIIGNQAFSDKKLQKQMQLTTKRGYGFSRRDLYSKQKLEGDQEKLRSFYTDQGYYDFDIASTNVTISPDKKSISIFISIDEGEQYQMGALTVLGADGLDIDTQSLFDDVKSSDTFSRKVISDIRKSINDSLANKGFGSASVNPIPTPNKAQKIVNVQFVVNAGNRLYVRQVNISGNTVTQDQVIRREMRQLEGGRFSAADVRRSQARLQRLGYFDSVRVDAVPVPGTQDQVDVEVVVTESKSTGSINFALGYAGVEGAIYQLGYNQRNFLGTGRELVIKLDNSAVTNVYELRYTNPYYSVNGVSRGFYLTSSSVDSSEAETAEYFADSIELGVNYKFPISESNSVDFTFFAENITLDNSAETPPELNSFIDEFPDNTNLGFRTALSKDTLNDFIFPTSGSRTSISLNAAIPGSDLEYYRVNLSASKYLQLSRSGYSLHSKLRVGYGGSYGDGQELPFYKNYFAGGPTTVRGFRSSSLGPLDTGDSPEPLGGDRRLLMSVSALGPKFGATGSKDKRLAAFVDGGMVYGSGDDIEIDELRYSAGLTLQWYNVLGPLSLSYAYPLNEEEGDKTQKFQISLGTLFR